MFEDAFEDAMNSSTHAEAAAVEDSEPGIKSRPRGPQDLKLPEQAGL